MGKFSHSLFVILLGQILFVKEINLINTINLLYKSNSIVIFEEKCSQKVHWQNWQPIQMPLQSTIDQKQPRNISCKMI